MSFVLGLYKLCSSLDIIDFSFFFSSFKSSQKPSAPTFHGSLCDNKLPLDDMSNSDATGGLNKGSSPSTSLIVHCVEWGSDFLNRMAVLSSPLLPWVFQWSVSGLDIRWSHSLRWSRKRAVINPERLDGANGRNMKYQDRIIEKWGRLCLRHGVGVHQHREESPRLKVVPQVFRKREHWKAEKETLTTPRCL